ncbi:MAG: hypothetical protein U0871_13325 [Gemmataceae bacterium]
MTELMILVERAVRPVRAAPGRKLRMREELLAHLTGIFEEEKARLGDDRAAQTRAAERFGDPAALTAELEDSLGVRDRVAAALDRWFGWRPPETAAGYMARLTSLAFFALLPPVLAILAAGVAFGVPSPFEGLPVLFVVGTADVFLFGLLYYKLRDAMHGAPWAARSRRRAAGYAALLVLLVPASAGLVSLPATLYTGSIGTAGWWAEAAACGLLGVAVAGFITWLAWREGPAEIRHTVWSSLDLGPSPATPA